ncbi:unnamed protein product [Arabidopsis lyrata]|uniref:Uncharacterized protein n=1 Tax=Arabidopsis lyrata subsp. lyrata TaxID=81972 RepID=D7KQF0_ARALL|nr:uncharacterized protein LOC9328806 [Arabidopsis lyrata subsp. lyrata]EFH69003.1 hypothetical protein ARALYDRAFT_888702 [Arabidopsis lyrata subsp. lyrata]CAH8252183.1 unnamed protein product [Arabidopsis lyrata]|eukprot:XP_002892744.1 uncharacterized protein LOC9328806 [Arabidopsis lyrata subsp. lyrata]
MEEEKKLLAITRTDSAEKKRVRDELSDEAVLDSPEVKRLRDDLFDVLDDSDPEPVSQDLDSVMKSFQDELSTVTTTTGQGSSAGETQPYLGYLLEASDDELGLPPPPSISPVPVAKEEETTETLTDLVRASSDSSGIDEIWGFENHVTNYGDLDFGSGVGDGGDYVAVEGLFEFSDDCFDSGDLFSWRSESLPAE